MPERHEKRKSLVKVEALLQRARSNGRGPSRSRGSWDLRARSVAKGPASYQRNYGRLLSDYSENWPDKNSISRLGIE